jgi:cytochrome c biogenesis protein CcmG, thiol:disulfide interchange protein DsbE
MKRFIAFLLFGIISLCLVGGFALFAVPAQRHAMTIVPYSASFGLASAIPHNNRSNPSLQVDSIYKEPPPFTFSDMKGSKLYSIEDFKGKVIFLNFWASWCGPCIEEWPGMQLLAERLGDNPNFLMVAVSIEDDDAALAKFLAETPTSSKLLLLRDKGATVANSFGSRAWPETYLIDPNGMLLHRFIGPRDWESKEAFIYLQSLLAKAKN